MKTRGMTSAPEAGPGARAAASRAATVYDAVMWPAERTVLRAWRRRLGRRARGRILEIGAGTGSQLRWYAAGAEVVALEPDPALAARARERARAARAAVTVVEAVAEDLPFADASFDTVVGSLVFCTVADPERAFAEVRRVVRPGGLVMLLEHVHLPWQPGRALQSLAAPSWERLAGGCRIDRDTVGLLEGAGFAVLELHRHLARWVVEVVAAAPEESLNGGGDFWPRPG